MLLLPGGTTIVTVRAASSPLSAGMRPALAALSAPAAVGASRWYRSRGSVALWVEGEGCCGDVRFPGAYEMDYEVDDAGRVRVTRLQTAVADMDISFRFLIFETARVSVRCGSVRNDEVIHGTVDASGNLTLAAGAATLSGEAFTERGEEGECGGNSAGVTLTNNAPVTILLDPAGNRLSLTGTFRTGVEGHDYDIRVEMDGDYANRPPAARFGAEGPGLEAFAQGGCPAVMRNGNPPEPVAEANDPAGLKMFLRSFSSDPDGAWGRADLRLDQWYYARDFEPYKYIGEGRRHGPLLFEFGPVHHLTLKTTDRLGASATEVCEFRVVDTTPPSVTAPPPAEIEATEPGGARPGASSALQKFLRSAAAHDLADGWPKLLPPLLNGKEVLDDTLFPIDPSDPPDEWLKVVFRFRDKSGNVGEAESSVRVAGGKK
jgi:hypothetical protein